MGPKAGSAPECARGKGQGTTDRSAALLDLPERLLAEIGLELPGRELVARVEDLLHLLDRSSLGLGVHELQVAGGGARMTISVGVSWASSRRRRDGGRTKMWMAAAAQKAEQPRERACQRTTAWRLAVGGEGVGRDALP